MAGTAVVAAVVVVMAVMAEVEMEMARPGMGVMEETAPAAEGMEGTDKVLKATLEADEAEAGNQPSAPYRSRGRGYGRY